MEEEIGRILTRGGFTVTVAESCTGGLIAARITDVPGASAYFLMGFVTYSNAAKERFLGVPEAVIAAHGAVSADTARLMAEGARRVAGTDIALAVTGIAGPSGGTPEKPVGTVFIALAGRGGTVVRGFTFAGDRRAVREQTADEALRLLLGHLGEGTP